MDADVTNREDGCLNAGCGCTAGISLIMFGWIVVLLIQRI